MKKQLLIITTLDTKGREAAYVKDCVEHLGSQPILMDVRILSKPQTIRCVYREDRGDIVQCAVPEEKRRVTYLSRQEMLDLEQKGGGGKNREEERPDGTHPGAITHGGQA